MRVGVHVWKFCIEGENKEREKKKDGNEKKDVNINNNITIMRKEKIK